MIIGSVNASPDMGSKPAGVGGTMDAYSRSLQSQIANAQKQLQELAKNSEMDPDTKMKKRQEIQKQISDLNMQLRQHQMEERRKAQQEKAQAAEAAKPKAQEKDAAENMAGIPQNSMKAVVSAQGAMKQAKIQGAVADQLQGRADVLETEMKLDGGRSGSSGESSKKAEIAELEAQAQTAKTSQVSTLADASRTMDEAAKTENKNGSPAQKDAQNRAGNADGTASGVPPLPGEPDREDEGTDTQNGEGPQKAEPGTYVDVKV